ncbi:MAG: PASTA domain-containing protein [Bacteroidales bacterium]|nr:PASTA domain-containing protein [Bacteroidales bacterium]
MVIVIIAIVIFQPYKATHKPLTPIAESIQNDTEGIEDDVLAYSDEAQIPEKLVRGKNKMPDFKGMPRKNIEKILKKLNVKYEIIISEDEFKQIPKHGTVINEGDSVKIYLLTTDKY